jgi:hypothetical protein
MRTISQNIRREAIFERTRSRFGSKDALVHARTAVHHKRQLENGGSRSDCRSSNSSYQVPTNYLFENVSSVVLARCEQIVLDQN